MARHKMIRRDITLENGTASWLLISQVEHARVSGELTSAWRDPFPPEVVEAITHHDDGWAKWEATPHLDVELGRPLSFLEMAVGDAIAIWNDSITAARCIGPLAGAIVAGHFIGLASGSEHASHPPARQWLDNKRAEHAAWLDEWLSTSAANTRNVADRAQQMLLTADLLSLWLCMNGPVADSGANSVPNREMQSRSSTVLGQYHFTTESLSIRAHEVDWQGSLSPWPFGTGQMNLESPALAVPVARYPSWAAVVAASHPIRLRWHLRQTLPPVGEC